MQSSWVKKFDAGQRNPYPEKQAKALPCTSSSAWYRSCQSACADLKALGHQVLLCFPQRFGRGVHPTEQPQSSSPVCSALTARLCHSGEESTGTRANSYRQQNKDSFFGVRVEEMQTASFPVKTPKGKMSSLLYELTGSPHPVAASW